MNIEQVVVERLKTLPVEMQREVLDFVEFLQTKFTKITLLPIEEKKPISVLEAAGDLIGCLEGGPVDLSTNPQYLEGFGEA